MDRLTRRRFLLASGVLGGGALATGAGALTLSRLLDTARPGQPSARRPVDTVVLVTLYGGNDGLNTVIPYADPVYRAARPELACPPEQVLRLDGEHGLHPALRGLARLWAAGRLAIVHGVGYPKPDRSHFRSMDIWQTAAPGGPADTGWVGRWLDDTRAPVEAAVSFEPVLPPLLVGRRRVGACVSYQGLELPDWVQPPMVAALGRVQADEPAMQARAAAAYADLVEMGRLVREAGTPAAGPADADPAGTATGTGGGGALGAQLALVARCVEAGVPTRVYSVSLGGFDTHAAERDAQSALLGQLDAAVAGFVDRMAGTDAGRRVAVVVYSEFGRRVRANASAGTDHGTAGPVLVAGARVAGGFHGEPPSLTDLDRGDLKATTDFRDVFGAVLDSVLDADPEQFLLGYRGRPLPLFRTG
ncbi:DUF1501 domain-containing protein [Micromonospora humidisoli]|uniref:DUF1501 domain-containing protein n=1 Tax=Micromonospora humidisoli TaxID=2807622 RepID=A0ABS2JIZ6_9ACTN|nr:DUF1501 domain-containing protein [Micromonospora humidisoli]MBM7086475.1 DUF1501 domain-containing protein [Micromonospora humidisoli]